MNFTELCSVHVLALYKNLYASKASDSKETIAHAMIYHCDQYLAATGNEYLDLRLKELINLSTGRILAQTVKKMPRKSIDRFLFDIMNEAVNMILSHNSIFKDEAIYNTTGRLLDHYSNKACN